jgi:hypothetical protein
MPNINVIREERSKGIKFIVVNAISVTNPGTESFAVLLARN